MRLPCLMDNVECPEPSEHPGGLSVTVAIPCYNAEKYLPELLEYLTEQATADTEILVIDDGSDDATVRVAKDFKVKVVVHEKNLGLASARNTALKHARGHIIVFFDADTLPHKRSVQLMLNEFTRPEIAGTGGQEHFFGACRNTIDLWRNIFWRQTHGERRIETAWMLMGLCCSYRKDALSSVGGFDEHYTTNGEDVDLGIRLTKAGYRLVYVPEIGVFHKRTDTLRSMILMAYRHSFWQSRALRNNGISPSHQTRIAIRWLFVAFGSSLLRHKNLKLAIISPVVCLGAIAGRLIESFSRR